MTGCTCCESCWEGLRAFSASGQRGCPRAPEAGDQGHLWPWLDDQRWPMCSAWIPWLQRRRNSRNKRQRFLPLSPRAGAGAAGGSAGVSCGQGAALSPTTQACRSLGCHTRPAPQAYGHRQPPARFPRQREQEGSEATEHTCRKEEPR